MNERLHDVSDESEGTCSWIVPDFLRLRQQQRGPFWIKGNPGVGKSTIMKYLFRREVLKSHSSADKVVVAFFCHGRGTDLQRTKSGIYRTILYQILLQDSVLRSQFEVDFQQKCDTQGKYSEQWTWHEHELENYIRLYLQKASVTMPVHVFVDALDECGEESGRALLYFFRDLCEAPLDSETLPSINICVSSRHYPFLDLESQCSASPDKRNSQDIRLLVEQDREFLDALACLRGEEAENLCAAIVSHAGNVFQWAVFVMRWIAKSLRAGERLDVIHKKIENSPKELYDLYHDVISSVQEDDQAQMIRLLEWVQFSERALAVSELRYALAINPDQPCASLADFEESDDFARNNEDMKKKIRRLSCGLIEVRKTTLPSPLSKRYGIANSDVEVAQSVHQSVADWCISDKGLPLLLNQSAKTVIGDAQNRICKACFGYLSAARITQQNSRQMASDFRS